MKSNKICTRIINENIQAVETNQPLSLSLRELKTDCRFMQFYNDFFNIRHKKEIKDEVKNKMREYYQRPEVKKKKREYNKRKKQEMI